MIDINKLMFAFFFAGTICTANSVYAMYYDEYNCRPNISNTQTQDRYPSVNANRDLVVPNSVIDISGNELLVYKF